MTTLPRPLVGAIRWDAWHGNQGMPGRAVQRSLGPEKYHWRLPFFAVVRGDDDITIDGTDQQVMDREIAYAADAGIDYWAFVTYREDDPMSLGLKRYLSSDARSRIRFCLLTEGPRWADPAFVARVARLMREPGYQMVFRNRPLLYLGFIGQGKQVRHWENAQAFRRTLDAFRAAVQADGLGNPYLVILDFLPEWGAMWADELGGDAISSYVVNAKSEKPVPYACQARADEAFWEACRATGKPVVPIVTSGWDRRPRVERPVPWERDQQPGVGLERYVEAPTPQEIADHLKVALDWIARHPDAAPARASLIYAWNENDEGGWLVPTLRDGPARLHAIGAMLRTYRHP